MGSFTLLFPNTSPKYLSSYIIFFLGEGVAGPGEEIVTTEDKPSFYFFPPSSTKGQLLSLPKSSLMATA